MTGYPRDLVGYADQPPDPRWPGGARLALNFVVNYEEGGERSVLHGDKVAETRLTDLLMRAPLQGARDLVESAYEYGSRVGFWRLMRVFAERQVIPTIYAVGMALERHERGKLSQEEAAEMLGVSERTFRRWRDRLREEGPEGLRDRRIGKPSSRRAAAEEILRMLGLYEERYAGFTVKHFHEQLQKRHDYRLGYTVTRLALQGAGLVRPAPKRSAHRKKRPRRPMVGTMLHQDASRFAWLPGDDRQYDLVVTLDDATSAIYSGFIVAEEGTASSFRALAEVIDKYGLFCELYTDRGSHYFHTPKAGEPVSKSVQTQSLPPRRRGSGARWPSSASRLGMRHLP